MNEPLAEYTNTETQLRLSREDSLKDNFITKLKLYLSIARPDHWVKHIFILPGIILAMLLIPVWSANYKSNIILGLISACLIASANYIINEWLDAEFDQHHPHKSQRAAVSGQLKASVVYLEYFACAISGILIAYFISTLFLITSLTFLLSGIVYNVRPFRTKERAYLDVISESFNNPIRIMLGWSMISSATIPPISLLLIFWFGGAFLMSVKRYSEYKLIRNNAGFAALASYRRSFANYSEASLLTSSFFYAILSSFALGIFLIKYRAEYILAVPLFAILFSYYLYLGVSDAQSVQAPEKLHREKGLIFILALLVLMLIGLTIFELPKIAGIFHSTFHAINLGF